MLGTSDANQHILLQHNHILQAYGFSIPFCQSIPTFLHKGLLEFFYIEGLYCISDLSRPIMHHLVSSFFSKKKIKEGWNFKNLCCFSLQVVLS